MKILVVFKHIPRLDYSSGERRFLGILQILAKNHHLVYCIPDHKPLHETNYDKRWEQVLHESGIIILPVGKGEYKKTIREDRYDAGFFEFFWMAEQYMGQFIKYQPKATVIVDSVDLHFAREETRAKIGNNHLRKTAHTKRRELLVYSIADMTIAVSSEDLSRLKKERNTGCVSLIPNIVPTVARKLKDRDPVLIFIGNYSWAPNVDGIKWFVGNVWPLVRQAQKNSRMILVGSYPSEEIMAMTSIKGIQVVGHVPDTSPYLDAAAVSIAPLLYGGGMKGKVNEALAHGVPVVSTSVGAQGFNARNGEEMFIADDAGDFAASILKLLESRELQYQMGLMGQRLNERLCSPEVVETAINGMMEECEYLKKSKIKGPSTFMKYKLELNRILNRYHWRRYVVPGTRKEKQD